MTPRSLEDNLDNLIIKSDELGKIYINGFQKCQYTKDMAIHSKKLYKSGLPAPWEEVNGTVSGLTDLYNNYLLASELPKDLSDSTAGTVVATCDSAIFSYERDSQNLPDEQIELFESFRSFAYRQEIETETIDLMKKFNLDKPYSGEKSPIEMLKDALNIFHYPPSDKIIPSTSLYQVRDSIDAMVTFLNNQKPKKQYSKGIDKKVRSILDQAKNSDVNDFQINLLAIEAKEICDDLSGKKKKNISKEEWTILINRSLLFIKNLLLSINNHKLSIRL